MNATHYQHQMQLETVSPIGTEEWVCPVCERRLLQLAWHPDRREIIVNPGDASAQHHRDIAVDGDRPPLLAVTEDEAQRLQLWAEWLDQVDFASWWSGASPL